MEILFVLGGLFLGCILSVLFFKSKKTPNVYESEAYKQLDLKLRTNIVALQEKYQEAIQTKSILIAKHENLNVDFSKSLDKIVFLKQNSTNLENENSDLKIAFATLNNTFEAITKQKKQLEVDYQTLKKRKENLETNVLEIEKEKINLRGQNKNLQEKLASQKTVLENLQNTFEKEFKIISQKILEQNNQKFMNDHQKSLGDVLKPLTKDLDVFKNKVEELYINEAKERFSLGEEIKKLNELNHSLKQEAQNLTKALKTESKTQGGWGEMILESILEKSGLRKNEEYFMEHQLVDDDGKPLKSDSENKKMRPDAVIKYPGDRHVIIDSKVSLNAYLRYVEGETDMERKDALNSHVKAVKVHIDTLSNKGYDDYNKALDFVMLFFPNEPAYIAAIQHEPNLWNYAYQKRILLLNPTNLITSLKLIVDLWKREYQNKNVQAIIERGAKMYDKFVGFIDDLDAVGEYMDKAKNKHEEASKKLKFGNDNLLLQMDKLAKLGIKNKKQLKSGLIENTKQL